MSTTRRFLGARALIALALFTACGRTEICDDTTTGPPGTYAPGDELVSQVNGVRGLWTSPDDLEAPDGALTEAINTALYRPGIMEPRRGEAWLTYTSIGGTIDALTEFQGYPVAHYGTTIKYFNGTSWVAYSGSFSPRSGKPARFFTQAGSLFFLSSAGVYELDAIGNAWRLTGAPAALQGSAALRRTTSETGFASANGQWAYRYVWGYTNANNKVQLGAPSGRFILTSPANVVVTTGNASKTSGTAVVTVVNTTHGFATGEYVDVTLGGAEAHFTAGRFSVTRVSATSFTYNDGGDSTYSGNPSNSTTYGFTSRNATLTVPIPAQITTSYFLQVYRSAKSADSNSEPSDALAQVYEKSPTNVEVAAGTMTVTDLVPDELRGATLYTSLGEPPHNQPPACADVAVFREGTLYGCTAQLQIMELSLLGIGGTTGLQTGVFLAFSNSPSNLSAATWTDSIGLATTESDGYAQLFTAGSVAQNIADTARSIVRAINSATNNSHVYAAYVSGDTDAPGKIRVCARSLAIEQFSARISTSVGGVFSGGAFVPTLPTYTLITNMARSGSTVTVNMAYNHSYVSGQQVEFAQSDNTSHFPNGVKTITVVDPDTFTYTEAGTAVVAEANAGIVLSAPVIDVVSGNTDVASSVMWAPPDEPWNVPAINFKVISPSGTLDSLVTTRDRVLIYTTKGLYSGTGDGFNWAFPEFDVTLNSKAPRTAISANGKAYGWFESGFAEMVESARIVSYPIDKTLRDLLTNAASTVATVAFAVAYEPYRMVLLFVPNASGDTAAKSVYVLHTDTGDWTGPWPLDGFQSAGPVSGAAMVSPTDGKLYLASGGYVAKERKALTAADQVEALVPGVLADVINGAPVGNVVTLTGTTITGLGSGILGATLLDSTSGASSTITALNATLKTVTLTSATGFADTNAVTLVSGPITSTIRPLAMTEGDAGAQKIFREGSLAFRNSQFTSGSLTFSTDLSPTFSAATTLTPPGGSSANPTEIDFWVPQSWQRATRLSMRFSHTGLAETYGLQGWTLRSRICSKRTTR